MSTWFAAAFIRRKAVRRIAICFFSLGWVSPAFCSLGDTLQSVNADQARMSATLKIIEADHYTVHEMTSSTGTVVREYISRVDGHVFAIAWQGPFIPDMKRLLGSYFSQYCDAAKQQRDGHIARHSLDIQQPGLVFQSTGHMRSYYGRAYDPGLMPASVTVEDIR